MKSKILKLVAGLALFAATVSAKDITDEERKRLNGHIQAVYQKGSLPTRKFVDQVIQVIEENNEAQGGPV